MAKYKRKETVDAVQYRGEENMDDVIAMVGNRLAYWAGDGSGNNGGVMMLAVSKRRSSALLYGDYIVKNEGRRGADDTFKIVQKHVFEREYEEG